MLNATQLRNGTRFSAAGQVGVFKKTGQNEDGTVSATMLFGSEAQDVGKEVVLPGDIICYYMPDTVQQKEHQQERKTQKRERRRVSRPTTSDANVIYIVDHGENVITSVNKPSAQLSNAVLNADSFKFEGKKYTVEEVAYDFDSGDSFVIVTE